ncbi:zinc finger BED domain-containing protein 4-like [Ostrinia furnacalis]|uniref:zinc finger BED domain-containing protein 4-like n=1 Tax=Ostrinia furnacalis TaxID=93504 RepID=UPI00103C4A2F|nr:zinc finger BED domain-containing protein 4-like [Ostrinia furnacalis]
MNLSAELTALIEKVKAIVGYFKRSTKAWEKLKKFQIQADKSVKRPLQSVCTRWNSLFYMLERMLEIKEEVNSALSNLDSTALSLSQIEWEICEHVCHILRPCEEVTKEISGQKYVAGSMVIPITTGLISCLENLDSRLYHPTAQCLQQDLISKLKKRFVNLDKSRIFTRAMFLDPRFKLYFEDPTVAENTKQSIIQSVTSLINKEDRKQPIAPAASEEEEQPRPSASSSTFRSIWNHYNKKMQNIQPKGTGQSRAIIEVQRYLEDKIIMPDKNTSPLNWWKEHRNIYPHLYTLAVTTLNTMATSVPCERIFSACGNLINDRRTRLGCRKVQQLMFLNQNTD